MIGAVGGIKAPAAIAVDRQAGDGGADGCIGSRLAKDIHIVGSELSGDSGSVFCGELGCGEGCYRRIVGAGDGDDKRLGITGTLVIDDGIGDGYRESFTDSKVLIGINGGIKRPSTIAVDGQASNRFAFQSKGGGGIGVDIGGGERAADDNAIFCDGLGRREGGKGIVVGAGEGDDESFCIAGTLLIGD